jgi:hypothetical protein
MTWVREGHCCRCGQCCNGGVDGLLAQVDGACPYLGPEHAGERLCTLHGTTDTYWSRGCNVWPSVPYHIQDYDRCTFSFRWVSDGH